MSKVNITKEEREMYKQYILERILTVDLVIAALATCEDVISKNAYLEKKWGNYYIGHVCSAGDKYKLIRLEWMDYRKKLQQVLKGLLSMREIVQRSKSSSAVRVSQQMVKDVVQLVDSGDYRLLKK